jgi:NADH-ubiquinone oxidoreductase chain 6
MNNILIDFISLLAILSSVLVITSKNPVVAVIFLISLFINTAVYLILLGIGFVGISYIIIYIGAITVIFLFVILMINIRLVDIFEIGREYTKNLPLALLVGSLFVFELLSVIPYSSNNISLLDSVMELFYYFNGLFFNASPVELPIVNIISYSPDFIISSFTQIATLGQGLYTYGAIWLLIVSFILLLSMVGAIILTNFSQESKGTSLLNSNEIS